MDIETELNRHYRYGQYYSSRPENFKKVIKGEKMDNETSKEVESHSNLGKILKKLDILNKKLDKANHDLKGQIGFMLGDGKFNKTPEVPQPMDSEKVFEGGKIQEILNFLDRTEKFINDYKNHIQILNDNI